MGPASVLVAIAEYGADGIRAVVIFGVADKYLKVIAEGRRAVFRLRLAVLCKGKAAVNRAKRAFPAERHMAMEGL